MSNNMQLNMRNQTIKIDNLDIPFLQLTPRQICDVECILNHAFYPLAGFLNQADYHSVLTSMRLKNGNLWPIPINLDIDEQTRLRIGDSERIILINTEYEPMAWLKISECWQPDKSAEAELLYRSHDMTHPGVAYLFNRVKTFYLSGKLECIQLPVHHMAPSYYLTPWQTKKFFEEKSWKQVIGFQTRNPLHKAHVAMMTQALFKPDTHLLLHPVMGVTKPGDIAPAIRLRCYQRIMKYFDSSKVLLSLLPLAMRMAGPREALWHALIRQNYGCTHFLIGRDHAGPGKDSHGQDFYHPYAAQKLAQDYQQELNITIMPVPEMIYAKEHCRYQPITTCADNETIERLSGTQFRQLIRRNQSVPAWFSFPEVVDELRQAFPSKLSQGLVIFLTGLSGSGKSTIAHALQARLELIQQRIVTLLDGDDIRRLISKGLGFTREDRQLNIERIGFIAATIAKHRGIALCAAIAPYSADRQLVKQRVEQCGAFFEIHVSTPLTVCENRDPKGLYKKARRGELKGFTGIDDIYEVPSTPSLVIDSSQYTVTQCVDLIVDLLEQNNYVESIEKVSEAICVQESLSHVA